jgi:hypothetical protein
MLYNLGSFSLKNTDENNESETFWTCFSKALNNNKKGLDGKQRILSIIAECFTYGQLESQLKVREKHKIVVFFF